MALQIRYAQFDILDLIWYLISTLCFLLIVDFEKKKVSMKKFPPPGPTCTHFTPFAPKKTHVSLFEESNFLSLTKHL
jgi:hypothetical protein